MDPLADKLLVCSAFDLFCRRSGMCDAGMGSHCYYCPRIYYQWIPADCRRKGCCYRCQLLGKVKTVVQMLMSIVLILDFSFSGAELLEWILIWAAVVLTVISLLDYIYKNRAVLSDTETR